MLYELEMMFTASAGLKEINNILRDIGCNESLMVKDAVTITVTQVLPEIPNEDYLEKVADILKNGYVTKHFNITECRFSGYRNVRAINQEELQDAE